MSDESEVKLYALAVVALRTVNNETEIGVQSVLTIIRSGGNIQRDGWMVAHNVFPDAEGWSNHFVSFIEIAKDATVGSDRLTWQLKPGEPKEA